MAKSTVRKELKQPDEFISFWTRAAEATTRFASERKRALIVGATMLVTVMIGSLIVSRISEGRATRASETLQRIEKIATAELLPEGGAPAAEDNVPRFKTEKERAEAALRELDAFLAGSHNPLTAEGRLERGPLLLALGRADDAIATYEQVLRDKPDERLRFLAHEGLGYAQEAKGAMDQAATTFGKLTDDAAVFKDGAFYKDRALYHKARISELRGNPDDAKKIYREVLDKNPTTSLRDEITNRLAVLELK